MKKERFLNNNLVYFGVPKSDSETPVESIKHYFFVSHLFDYEVLMQIFSYTTS